MPITTITEIVGYICGTCEGNNWTLHVGHRSDGRTFLFIWCTNPDCMETRRIAEGASENDMITWGEFDITNQGFDPLDVHKPGEMN